MQIKLVNLPVPQTWEELVSLKEDLSHCDVQNTRFTDHQNFYHAYQNLVSKEIRHQILMEQIGPYDINLVLNSFPYLKIIQNLPNILHYCLWSKIGPLTSDQVESAIKEKIKDKDYFWFENADIIKSIPEVWHCHVFVKEK